MHWFDLIFGLGFVCLGCARLFGLRRLKDKWEARRSELKAGAPERYFEEARALEAYPPGAPLWASRSFALWLIGFGAARLMLMLLR